RKDRRPDQQRRRHHLGTTVPGVLRGTDREGGAPLPVPHAVDVQGGPADDDLAGRRHDRQRLLGGDPRGQPGAVCRVQGRRERADLRTRARGGPARRPGRGHRPGRDARPGTSDLPRGRRPDRAGEGLVPADRGPDRRLHRPRPLRDAPRAGRADLLPRVPGGLVRHRLGPPRRRRRPGLTRLTLKPMTTTTPAPRHGHHHATERLRALHDAVTARGSAAVLVTAPARGGKIHHADSEMSRTSGVTSLLVRALPWEQDTPWVVAERILRRLPRPASAPGDGNDDGTAPEQAAPVDSLTAALENAGPGSLVVIDDADQADPASLR